MVVREMLIIALRPFLLLWFYGSLWLIAKIYGVVHRMISRALSGCQGVKGYCYMVTKIFELVPRGLLCGC